MFKLFKDLTRPPESLSAPSLNQPTSYSTTYAARQRAKSPSPALHTPGSTGSTPPRGRSRANTLVKKEEVEKKEEVVETDQDALKVVELLRSVETGNEGDEVMFYVEVFSQILSVPSTSRSLRAFRRHRGFEILLSSFGAGLEYKSECEGEEEEQQVREVQRWEGVRLGLEVLAWSLGDRESLRYFQRTSGYMALLPILRRLGQPGMKQNGSNAAISVEDPSSSTANSNGSLQVPQVETPDPRVLAHLLAHIFNNNYTLLSLFQNSNTVSVVAETKLSEKIGDLVLRWGEALPLLWAYVWGINSAPSGAASAKGKARATSHAQDMIAAGYGEDKNNLAGSLEMTFKILSAACHSSTPNLLNVHKHLPHLADFLMTRIFGPDQKRKYEVTFPARDDWYVPDEEDEVDKAEWTPPPKTLRAIYYTLLKRLLEAGVTQGITWRLFTLVRNVPGTQGLLAPSRTHNSSAQSSQSTTPAMERTNPMDETPKATRTRPKPPQLSIPKPDNSAFSTERLNTEVLSLIRHAMKSRSPDLFVFRGGRREKEGGLEVKELGRPWATPTKGFNFSCWLYIEKLNHPLTVLHLSQAGSTVPLFQIRILENSQIALYSSVYKASNSTSDSASPTTPVPGPEAPLEEIICNAPDALVPHGQWVHFAVGVRKPKGSETGETRIFVNGVRVGAMRIAFPVPAPPTAPAAAPQLHVKPVIPLDAVRVAIGRPYRDDVEEGKKKAQGEASEASVGYAEENEWMLGRSVLLEEAVTEDIVLLMHHLGPRYSGNYQEALGKFLTYEAATSINIYLSALAQAGDDKRKFALPANSVLVRAVRQGPAFAEESILVSLSARDTISSTPDQCVNGAVPHPFRAQQLRHGIAHLVGNVEAFSSTGLDEVVTAVGGGTVILKMVDMAQTTEELVATLGIFRDMIKDSWAASEEMERIRGFEVLAAILRPKMVNLVDVACTKIILSLLGINMDKPTTATVHNSVAYRALGLEFELWSYAPLGVASLFLQHFEYLLQTSKHARFNLLRTFQKSSMVRKLLYALRSNMFDAAVVPVVVDTLRLALIARWSGEDAIKPVFSYLVSALCQSNNAFMIYSPSEAPPAQSAASLILAMIADLSHHKPRLLKLNKALALQRLLVIFISSNSAYYVILPCLDILERCLVTPGMENFQRSFEAEGGFALLARTLGPMWRADVQAAVFRMLVGTQADRSGLQCSPLLSSVLSGLDSLLQVTSESEDTPSRLTFGRTKSDALMSARSAAFALSPVNNEATADTRLEDLLKEMTAVYRASQPFRKAMTSRRVEIMLPAIADFAAVSGSSSKSEIVGPQRSALAQWLMALIEVGKLSSGLNGQLNLVLEQLRASIEPSKIASSASSFTTSPASPRPSSGHFGSSLASRFGTTPPASPIPRRRPSTDSFNGLSLTPSRSRSVMEKRTPLKRTLTNESILDGGRDKNAAWKLIIIQTDTQAHSKMTLERKEHWQRISQVEWPKQASGLRAENGLWPDEDTPVTWRLDGSEGPLRMRNRLERINAVPEQGMARTRNKLRDAIPSLDELSSAVSRINVAPWEDPFALALGEAAPIEEEVDGTLAPLGPSNGHPTSPSVDSRLDDESFVEVEENKDDKMRRIAKTLSPGDVVEEAHNIVRIVGVDACPGLLILGKKNLYLVDGLVQTPDGEVIDAKDAPRDALTIPSGTLAELDGADQQSHRWFYNEIVENNKRAFLFRDVALELYFSDKLNFLIVFKDKRERQAVAQKISHRSESAGAITRSVIGNFVRDQVARGSDKSEQQLEAATRKWQTREISNFAYLQLLNQYANRTPNDVTQYPVFPWVLSDYTSQRLDLDKVSAFRDLTRPMGALTPARRAEAEERYSATEGVGEKPFHYGTHYSSSMIVCGYMIRLSPFTEIFLALQGGNFDLADRLFSSIPRAWESASSENRGDVRELIPEFYYSPTFLNNINRHDFGRKQTSGDSVDSVILPPWALGDPLLFIHRHREALESDIVSKQLPQWIDLTFGCKQRDPASFNCFHPLSYRGAVDLESIEDESEKAASTAIIHNFGQTPLQIFKTPHVHRYPLARTHLPVGVRFGVAEHWQLLLRSVLPITETITPIDGIVEHLLAEGRPTPQQRHRLMVPGTHLSVQYGFTDSSLRIYYQDSTPRLVHLVEGISIAHAIFAAPTLLITVSEQSVLTAWRITVKGYGAKKGEVSLQREATLRGHTTAVTCLTASLGWSFVISGAADGTAMIWDMNRLRYIRTLQLPVSDPIKFCAVNESDGQIALCTARDIFLFSLNGHPIASTAVDAGGIPTFRFGGSFPDPPEDSEKAEDPEFTGGISFLNREFLKSGVLFVIGIGSEIALYRCLPGENIFDDDEPLPWRLVQQGRLSRSDSHLGGDCCMVRFCGEVLYAAFQPGPSSQKYGLYQWTLPEGPSRHVPDSIAYTCMADRCGRNFGLLEPKRYCGGCGGAFCGTHAVLVESFTQRYCEICRAQLSQAAAMGVMKNRHDSLVHDAGSAPGSRRNSIAPGNRRNSFGGPESRRSSVSERARSRERTPGLGVP